LASPSFVSGRGRRPVRTNLMPPAQNTNHCPTNTIKGDALCSSATAVSIDAAGSRNVCPTLGGRLNAVVLLNGALVARRRPRLSCFATADWRPDEPVP
jgi:hypothetical protein